MSLLVVPLTEIFASHEHPVPTGPTFNEGEADENDGDGVWALGQRSCRADGKAAGRYRIEVAERGYWRFGEGMTWYRRLAPPSPWGKEGTAA